MHGLMRAAQRGAAGPGLLPPDAARLAGRLDRHRQPRLRADRAARPGTPARCEPAGRGNRHGADARARRSAAGSCPRTIRLANVWFTRDPARSRGPRASTASRPSSSTPAPRPDPGGWPKGGQTRLAITNDHLQYALTWFGLALTLAGVFGAFAWRQFRRGRTRACSLAARAVRSAPDHPPRPSVLHVSTRGEAPAIGFTDALLAGLARDGGLYVPERWPALAPRRDRGLRRPAATPTSPRRVIGALVDGEIAAPDLGRMIAAAYAPFRHPAVAPLVQIGDNLFVLELFHGPTLAFKDVAMQSAGAAHGPRPEGARRPRHHRRRDLGRHRQRGRRRLHRARPGRRLHPVPARARLRRAAAADDDRRRRQRAGHRRRRHLRRLPGAREGDVQPRRASATSSSSPA